MVERRSGEVAVPLSAKKNFKRVVPIDMQTAVIEMGGVRVHNHRLSAYHFHVTTRACAYTCIYAHTHIHTCPQ